MPYELCGGESDSSKMDVDTSEDLIIPKFFDPELRGIEDLDKYEIGGLHPVRLHDTLSNGRYKIIHKLGSGGMSTIWLARDVIRDCLVAIKVCIASSASNNQEKSILQHLRSKCPTAINGSSTITDQFIEDGVNGSHQCFVFNILGPNLGAICEKEARSGNLVVNRLRSDIARRISKKMVEAVVQIHAADVVHGDLTPRNFLLNVRDLSQWSDQRIMDTFGKPRIEALHLLSNAMSFEEIESLNDNDDDDNDNYNDDGRSTTIIRGLASGQGSSDDSPRADLVDPFVITDKSLPNTPVDPHAPPYAVQPIELARVPVEYLKEDLCLIDFGQAFIYQGQDGGDTGIPPAFGAPESLLLDKSSFMSDIWSLACSIFYLRAGETIITDEGWVGLNEIMIDYVRMLGPLPEALQTAWGEDEEAHTLFEDNLTPTAEIYHGANWDPYLKRLGVDVDAFRESMPPESPTVLAATPSGAKREYGWHGRPGSIREALLAIGDHDFEEHHVAQNFGLKPHPWWESPGKRLPQEEVDLLEDLLVKALKFNPNERITAKEMLEHSYFAYQG